MPTPLLTLTSVCQTFTDGPRQLNALRPVSFGVDAGEFVSILGPSGSGKSTLLRIIGGLIRPTSGEVHFNGAPVDGPNPEIGFVFQKTNLMPWRTVVENVLLPIEIRDGRPDEAARRHALDLLDLVGLDGFADAYPKQLSGGMSQRVVLARTLIQRPHLLLMDEPFGALDALTRERLNLELQRIVGLQRQTVLMVTHSIQEAVFLSDRVLVLTERPGQIKASIPIDLPRPRRLEMLGDADFGHLATQVRREIGELGSD
jgi:NitT/TauT family transport system ATP-binding protein